MTPQDLQDLQDLLATLRTQPHVSLVMFAVFVGGLVRILKTKTVGPMIDWLQALSGNRIPKSWPAWMALGLGFTINFLNELLNVKSGWQASLLIGLAGAVLSGGGAIGGDQTVAKLLAPFTRMPDPPKDEAPPTDKQPPASGGSIAAKQVFGCALVMTFLAWLLIACGLLPSNTPQTKTEEKAAVDGTCTIVSAFAGTSLEQAFCADLDQLVQMGVFVRNLRADAGTPTATMARKCTIIPNTTVCATELELAAAIKNARPTDAGAT